MTDVDVATCFHPDAQSVITVDGERVGYVCPGCDAVLPADWIPRMSAIAAQALMAAGFDPLDAVTVTRLEED